MRYLSANGQPALAAYAPDPSGVHRLHTLQVFTISGGQVAHNVVFADLHVFEDFDLPQQISFDGFLRRDELGRCRRYISVNTDRGRPIMSVIVIQFITLDGIVSDPDGSGGTPDRG